MLAVGDLRWTLSKYIAASARSISSLEICPTPPAEGRSDARGGQKRLAAERVGRAEMSPDFVGDHFRLLGRIDLRQHDHELIATIPADCVANADTGQQSPSTCRKRSSPTL